MDNLTAGNPVAHRVRVYYTGSDTLYEGEPLCYSFKTTRNWFGGSVNNEGEVTTSEYVAEGSHNASKYICVESPFRASITSMDSVAGSNVITGDGTDFANFHVGMAVSIASASDANADGNYVITAVGALGVTITLDMTAAEAAAVTTQADVTVQIDNISSPAGIVAKGGWCGQSGPRAIDIYVPNGAVVPVRTDQNCVLGRTILAVNSNEQYLTAPLGSYARPVAIAWETVDTAATTGLVLAKLDPNIFIYQKGDNAGLLVDDEDTGTVIVNRIDVDFSQASGQCTALSVKAKSTVAQAASYDFGLALYVQADWDALAGLNAVGSGHWVNLNGGTTTGDSHITSLWAGVYEDGVTFTAVGYVTALTCSLQVADALSGDPGNLAYIMFRNDGAQAIDALFTCEENSDIGLAASAVTPDYSIPIKVRGTTYYLSVASTTT